MVKGTHYNDECNCENCIRITKMNRHYTRKNNMLKQQLQKTEEGFDEKFESVTLKDIQIPSQKYVDGVKQFIRQSQIDAVKAFAEETNKKLDGMQFADTTQSGRFALHADGYNQGLEEAIDEINNLLKDI